MACYLTTSDFYWQPQTTVFCPAKTMTPWQRQGLALKALAGSETVSQLAQRHEVSRKFIYQQAAKAEEALDEAFLSAQHSDNRGFSTSMSFRTS